MELKKYDLIGEPIGVGSYGRVFKGKVKETGEHIAVKLIDKVSLFCFSLHQSKQSLTSSLILLHFTVKLIENIIPEKL